MLDSIERQEINQGELDDLMLVQEIKTITSQSRFDAIEYIKKNKQVLTTLLILSVNNSNY